MARTLRLILGDQLNIRHSWFGDVDGDMLYAMMEIRPESEYATHHIQKVACFFAAMRRFRDRLREAGHRVMYFTFDGSENRHSFHDNLAALVDSESIERFEYMLPDEYRLDRILAEAAERLAIPCTAVDSEHFLTDRDAVRRFFSDRKTCTMEYFYREVRRRYGILMEDGEPLTGRWNYDAENRKSLPDAVSPPEPYLPEHDLSDIVAMIAAAGIETIGSIDPARVTWPLTREEALAGLDHFLAHGLARFGAYQDAMTERHPFLYHSRLSFALNVKLIHPLEVVERTVDWWRAHEADIDIAQVEGFVRQIIGWREYMRGIYWDKMPGFAESNFFGHHRPLPAFFWTGDTRMNCLKHAIGQSLEHAYAHHIQRLMITGNFALLAGIHPDEVDAWYLGIYIDAIEWVEITNTRGMSQFADGGVTATKPYVSSANYINRMSDYCGNCDYAHTKRTGEGACPFNSLYWDFFDRHHGKLGDNHRLAMVYRMLDRMDPEERTALRDQAEYYRQHLDDL